MSSSNQASKSSSSKQLFHEGKLEVNVIQAKNLPAADRLSKKDTYVELTINNLSKKSLIDHKGGYNPRWNDKIMFEVAGIGKNSMLLRIKEAGKVFGEEICSCAINLTRIYEEEEFDGWYPLIKKDKAAGFIYLEFTFIPKDGRKKQSRIQQIESLTVVPTAAPPISTKSNFQPSAPPPVNSTQPNSHDAPATQFSALSLTNDYTNSFNNTSKYQSSTANSQKYNQYQPPSLSQALQLENSKASIKSKIPDYASNYALINGKKPLPSKPNIQTFNYNATLKHTNNYNTPIQVVLQNLKDKPESSIRTDTINSRRHSIGSVCHDPQPTIHIFNNSSDRRHSHRLSDLQFNTSFKNQDSQNIYYQQVLNYPYNSDLNDQYHSQYDSDQNFSQNPVPHPNFAQYNNSSPFSKALPLPPNVSNILAHRHTSSDMVNQNNLNYDSSDELIIVNNLSYNSPYDYQNEQIFDDNSALLTAPARPLPVPPSHKKLSNATFFNQEQNININYSSDDDNITTVNQINPFMEVNHLPPNSLPSYPPQSIINLAKIQNSSVNTNYHQFKPSAPQLPDILDYEKEIYSASYNPNSQHNHYIHTIDQRRQHSQPHHLPKNNSSRLYAHQISRNENFSESHRNKLNAIYSKNEYY
ncbi:hypothetical protein BB561_005796 [Smittium simulii]|uniref:C2 domain-containing protein n=1 Tax=Smittium simulii TaxID=133385 RepID=A0A2T9Y871_9FUNG|nr:hypothetical protein BB561_005796 [Smittium simulii]